MNTIRRSVGLLVASPFEQLNLIGPSSVFSFARSANNPAYDIHLLATTNEATLRSSNGLVIGPAMHYAKFNRVLDTLLVVGGEGAMMASDATLKSWLREQGDSARRIGAICTGAFLLAEAGLLNKKKVVTHWRYCDELARQYPKIKVERDPIFVKDGKIYTTAGVSAGIDLALALVEEDLGHEAVIAVSRELMLFPRRLGGQTQFSYGLAEQKAVSDGIFRDLKSWAMDNLTQDLSVRILAQVVSMSERTFARRFGEEFSTTPAIWVQSLRIEAARRLLENGNLSLNEIAARAGYRDLGAFRKRFKAHLFMDPKEYQERFRRINLRSAGQSTTSSIRRTGTLG